MEELLKQSKELSAKVETEILAGIQSRKALTKFRVKRTWRGFGEWLLNTIAVTVGWVIVIATVIFVVGLYSQR